ncbi:LytTR family DNA-binding domain-containing protein [Rubrivirga sp. S365]|uniref:LytR/AlgR family response regulator transcription factor n=1 Tax=Rubrivirga sp. S365 TaxID=3076080 RepID=UPI0028C82F19|nr:LytTR family DNA-binding domain-containing protein [Rubrivirga sp. S365]MDT7856702.1 LytTR family DNA-binding domain-containing protein [Rubrivirga sp. S365]
MAEPLRVLVVDDEPLARQRVLDLLTAEPDVEVVGTAGTGRQAVAALAGGAQTAGAQTAGAVDVVFLDVQMPGLSGLEVAREVGPEAMPATVFVTAYDQHALAAFDVAAVDYLLKPFDDDRFRQALGRAREAVRLREVDALRGRLAVLLGAEPGAAPPERPAYLERIAVEGRGQVRLVPVADVDYVVSDGPYAEVHAGGEVHVIRETMRALEEQLDPALFFRVHRSTIVQVDRVEALLTAPGGDYAVRLRDGTRLGLSRSRRDAFARRLGVGGAG